MLTTEVGIQLNIIYREKANSLLLFMFGGKSMNQRIIKLKAAVEKDKERIQRLQDKVKVNEEKTKEPQRTAIATTFSVAASKVRPVNEIVDAIRVKDIGVLMEPMTEQDNFKDKSGSTSAFEISKEEDLNE